MNRRNAIFSLLILLAVLNNCRTTSSLTANRMEVPVLVGPVVLLGSKGYDLSRHEKIDEFEIVVHDHKWEVMGKYSRGGDGISDGVNIRLKRLLYNNRLIIHIQRLEAHSSYSCTDWSRLCTVNCSSKSSTGIIGEIYAPR